MSVAKARKSSTTLMAGMAAITVATAAINLAPMPTPPPALTRVVEAPVSLTGLGDPIAGAGFLASDALFRLGGIASGVLGPSLLHLPNVIAEQPGAVTAYFLRGVINGLAEEVAGILNGQQDIPGGLAGILSAISYNAQQLAAVEGNVFGGGLLGAAASAKADSVQADVAALPPPNLGIGQFVAAAGSLTGFLLSGVGGILTPLLGINLHIPGVISDQPYAITQYFLRGVINYTTSEIGAVIDGQQDIPGALAAIVGAISSNAQQLAAVEAGIFGDSGLLGAAAGPQQVSAKAESVQIDAAALPLPNLGIGSAISGVGSLVGFGLQAAGGVVSPVLGIDLHIPAVISSQPYVLSAYFLRPVITDATAALGAVVDGQQDVPGAVSAILGALSQYGQQLAAVEGPIFSGGLLPSAASPQQISAKTFSIPEAKNPDPVGSGTAEVKSLAAKVTDESTPASTGAPSSVDKDKTPPTDTDTRPAGNKDKTPPADADKAPAAGTDKTPAKEPDKTGSEDKDKTPTGTTDKTPADKDKTPSSDKDKPSSDHDKG